MSASPLPHRGSAVGAAPPAPRDPARRAGQRPGARPRQLRAVPRRRRSTDRLARVATAVAATVLVVVGVLGTVTLNALAAEASFEARALEREISDLTLRHDDLVAAVASLESPSRVRDVAVGSLGLLEPEVPGFLTLDPEDLPDPAPKPPLHLGR